MDKLQAQFNTIRSETTLNNGARVVLFQRKNFPLYIRAFFRSGSEFDPIDFEGLSHFTEHMLVAGSKEFNSKDKLAAFIENQGGVFSAFTNATYLAVNVSVVDATDLHYATTILRAILCEALMEPKTIETERGSIIKEIGDRESNPSMYLWEIWRRLFLQGTPVGRSTLGNRKSVNNITETQLANFYNNMFTGKRLVYVVSGDIDLDTLAKSLENEIPVKSGIDFVIPDSSKILRNKDVEVCHYEGNQAHLMVGFRSSSETSKDNIPLNLLATILGGGRASVLSRRLRYEKGLVYGVHANQYGLTDTGSFFVKTSTTKSDLQEVLSIIAEEFGRIARGNISTDELDFAINKITKGQKREMQTSESWVDFHAINELYNPTNVVTLPTWLEQIANTTIKDITEVGKKYFESNKWYIAACGDLDSTQLTLNF